MSSYSIEPTFCNCLNGSYMSANSNRHLKNLSLDHLFLVALYRPHCDKQRKEMERMQAEESLSLPQDIDYLTLPVSLSREVREILDAMRPSTVRPMPLKVKSAISVTLVARDLNRPQVFSGTKCKNHYVCANSLVGSA